MKRMRNRAFLNCLSKTAVGLIIISFFCLFINPVYADNVPTTSEYPSNTYKKSDNNSQNILTDRFLNGFSLITAQADIDNLKFADGETNYATKNFTGNNSGAGASAKDWSFSFAPYLWLVGLNGTMGVKGQTADVDVSFGDIWENLDFAFQGHAEIMYRSKYGFFVDGTYLKLATKDVKGPLNIKTTMKVNIWEFVGIYRFYDQPSGFKNSKGQSKPSFSADLLGGGRYIHLDNKINFGGNGPIGVSNQVSGGEGWFDFLVGTRIKWQATNRLSFIGRTDIGGFGLGFSSDIAWNLQGFVGVDITDWMQFLIGYKVFYDDYSNGSGNNRFVFDAWMSGPITGLNFVF